MNKKNLLILASITGVLVIFGVIITAAPPDDTPFLEEVWNAIFGIENEVDQISEDVNLLKMNLDLLEKIHALEIRIAVLETCGPECESGFPSPCYDSGWHKLTPGQNLLLLHNLNTVDYFVYFIVTEDSPLDIDPFVPASFHNFGTGGAFVEDYMIDRSFDLGTYWKASKNSIDVYRYPDDTVCNYARVMLWKIS